MTAKRYLSAAITFAAVLACGLFSPSARAQYSESSGAVASGATGLPGLARELTLARIDAAKDWAGVLDAQARVRGLILQAQQQADASPELRQARIDLAAANRQENLARQKALAQLNQDARYKNLLAQRNQAEDQIHILRQRGQEGLAFGVAEVKLRYNSQITAMEKSALDANREYQDARNRRVAADEKVRNLYRQLHDPKREVPQLADARKAVNDAEQRYAAAARRLAGADAAYGQAIADRNFDRAYQYELYSRWGWGWNGWGWGGGHAYAPPVYFAAPPAFAEAGR